MIANFISSFVGSAIGALIGGSIIMNLIIKEMDRRYVKKGDKWDEQY